jgi:DNA-binding XRE family transcriptional regulator
VKTFAWKDLNHRSSPEKREQIRREALEEYDRMGFAALRKAREQTQVELAEKLGINQASVSVIENNTDLLLSTLAKYVRALGGEVEIRAVFPEATFNLSPILGREVEGGRKKASSARRGMQGRRSDVGRKVKATA